MQDTTRENPASTPHYYPIDEEGARRAHELMSFRDYKPGSKTAEYRRMVDAAAELAEAAGSAGPGGLDVRWRRGRNQHRPEPTANRLE